MIIKFEVKVFMGMVLLKGILKLEESWFGSWEGDEFFFSFINYIMMVVIEYVKRYFKG